MSGSAAIRLTTIETSKPARKSSRPVRKPSASAARIRKARERAKRWAGRYVVGAVVSSSGLNAYAAFGHVVGAGAGPAVQAAAVAIGAAVPVGVFGLAKAAGWFHKGGMASVAKAVGAAGLGVLALSVIHCAGSIGALTGTATWLSYALAVGVDVGMVSCEVGSILADGEDE